MPMINNYLYSKKNPSDRIGFDYYYQTFYYTIYSKYDEKTNLEIFYMASEDKASLLARLDFYKNYISDIDYPIIDRHGRPDYVAGNSSLAMLYVLSLPEECFKSSNKEEPLSPETAIDKIIFIDSLNQRKDMRNSKDCFISDRFYRPITNHLISRGFYFLNIEALSTNSTQVPFDRTPFIINEDLFYKKYQKATAERIYISFSRIGLIKPDEYLEYYKKIDSMSLKEQIDYAFEIKETDNDIEYSVKIGLIQYYFAILRKEARDYFDLFLNDNANNIRKSVLDYTGGNHFLKYTYFALGTHFSLVAKESRKFKSTKSEITEQIIPSDFKLLSQDIKRLKFTFNAVKSYLDLHQEYKYMPHLFIKMMGLPFELVNLVRNFNFRIGTAQDFISLIPIEECKEYIKYDIANLDGFVVDLHTEKLNYKLLDICKDSLYIFNYDESVFFDNNIILGKSKHKGFYSFLSSLIRVSTEENSSFGIINFRHELIKSIKEKKNIAKQTFNIAIEVVNKNNIEIIKDIDDLKQHVYDDPEDENDDDNDELLDTLFDFYVKKRNATHSSYLEKDETIYLEYLPLPYIHLGNNFIAYSNKDNNDIYFDTNQLESIIKFMEIINNYYSHKIYHYMYCQTTDKDSFIGRCRIKNNAKKILGLPSSLNENIVISNSKNKVYDIEKTLANLKTKNNISIESNKLTKIFKKDIRISYLLIFSDVIKKHGVISFTNYTRYQDNEYYFPYYKLPSEKNLFDDYIEMAYPFFGLSNFQGNLFHRGIKKLSTKFIKEITDLVSKKDYYSLDDKYNPHSDIVPIHYLVPLMYYFIYSSYESLFLDSTNYQITTPITIEGQNKIYVLYGEIFNAYSLDNRTWFFDINDKDLIYDAYVYNFKLSNEVYYSDRIIDKMTFGIPYILSLELIESVVKKRLLTKKEFEEHFKFKKKPDFKLNKVYWNMFSTSNNTHSLDDINSIVKYEAIKQGLYIWEASTSEVDYILDFEDTSLEYEEFLSEIDQMYFVYVSKNISGDVENYLKPNKTLFFALLQDFTKGLSSLNKVDIQKLLKLKYHVELLYDEDPHFIYRLINKIYTKDKTKLFNYLENKTIFLNNTRLDLPYKIKKQEYFEFLVAFLIYVIHSLIKVLCKYSNN